MPLWAEFFKKLFDPIEPTVSLGAVMMAAPLKGVVQFLEQLDLLLGQAYRGLNPYSANQISRGATAHWPDAFLPQAKRSTRLGFRRDFEDYLAV